MANFIVLPMAFLRGSFFLLDGAPGWLQALSHGLPLRHLDDAMPDVKVGGEAWTAALVPMGILAAFAVVPRRSQLACSAGRASSPDSERRSV